MVKEINSINVLSNDERQKLFESVEWFNLNNTLSYGCLINFVVGDRGGGKTFNILVFLINRFIKHDEQFIYLRRIGEELKDAIPTLFDDLQKEGYFSKNEFVSNRKGFYIDGKLMGLPKDLNTSMSRKSVSLPKVKWIWFEEFMVDGVTSRYINHKEVDIFRNFYETVARMRELKSQEQPVRIIFSANAFSTVNMYFTEYGVKLPITPPYKDHYVFRNTDTVVTIFESESYREAKKQTRWYKANAGSEFNAHAYENKFLLDRDDFIRKKPGSADFNFAIRYLSRTFTVWADWDSGYYYVSSKGGDVTKDNLVSLSMEDNSPNNISIRRVKNMPFMKSFRFAVDENKVFYDNLKSYHYLKEAVYLLQTTR